MATQKAVAENGKNYRYADCGSLRFDRSQPGMLQPLNIEAYSGGIGLPVPSTEVELRDTDGKEVPIGQPGEFRCAGPQVMKGY